MKDTEVSFTFEKVDGSLRKATGTLRVPSYKAASDHIRKENYKSIVFFDTTVGGFRSFRTENLISINA